MDVVFLHGPASSGKLTTARELEKLVGYPVFHNHLVVDLLTPIFPFGSDGFVRLREQFWLDVFGEAARADRSIIFTFAPESTVTEGFPLRAREQIERAGGRVRFVQLAVSETEQERRVVEPSRREFHKLSDVTILRKIRAQDDVERPPADLFIDTDTSGPAESAARIVEHFGLAAAPKTERYPS